MQSTVSNMPSRKAIKAMENGSPDHSVQKVTPYKVIGIIVLILLALFFIFPLYWILTGSFKDQQAVIAAVPQWFPAKPIIGNYERLFTKPAFLWMLNTVLICAGAMLLTCVTASMGGYALAKKNFTGRKLIFSIFVCAMALPKQVILIPLLK